MIGLLAKQLFRSRGLVIGLVVLFVVGTLSLHIGKTFVERQGEIIALTEEVQKEHLERHVDHIDGHIGLLLYYLKFGFANDRASISGLSIGQRDNRQAAQLVNIRNLEEQKNTSEILNPFFQLLGNLDFSFVLIYLFPLIIIALCFNLWSEEKERGRWPLLSVQSDNPKGILLYKILLRLFVILSMLLVLLVAAIVYLKVPLDSKLVGFALTATLYVCFWFALSWLVTSLDKSSKQNALILLSSWIILTIVLPSLVNSTVSSIYPIPEAYETTIDSRDGYHTKWDQPKEPTIAKFKEQYPQYAQYTHPTDASFSWFWYYAMQHMGDVESQKARRQMKEKLDQRNRLTKSIGYFVPSIFTQLSLNALCKTDMTNYLKYMEALESFHEKLRLSYYPDIFDATQIEDKNWKDYKLDFFTDQRDTSFAMFTPLVLINFILLGLTQMSFKRNGLR